MKVATAVALCVALLCVSGCSNPEAADEPRQQAPSKSVSVDFRTTTPDDGVIQFGDGQRILLSAATPGATAPILQNGSLTFTPLWDRPASGYLSTPDLRAAVTTMDAHWAFGAIQGGAIALSVSHGVNRGTGTPELPYGVRLVATESSWYIGVWGPRDPEVSIISTGEFDPPLPNAAELTARLWIVDNWVTAVLPNGQRVTADDTRVAAWKGNYANFELHTDSGEAEAAPKVMEFSAGTAPELPPVSR